ncbi:hypothetical protein BZG36_01275 [Bifiguratus adelaidae]|uniref:separase n=1 Tax=Bifiguratus adelaidae TaxID=1938954 RepID=A0A261Y5B9_9FUNG|nr:hypothetical protein BZG36_01275 [Bifiguratus adelaidae]
MTELLDGVQNGKAWNEEAACWVRDKFVIPFQRDHDTQEDENDSQRTIEYVKLAQTLRSDAMRIVNRCLSSLSALNQPKLKQIGKPGSVHFLGDIAVQAMAAIELIDHYAPAKPYEVDKALANMSSKLVEAKLYQSAATVLLTFCERADNRYTRGSTGSLLPMARYAYSSGTSDPWYQHVVPDVDPSALSFEELQLAFTLRFNLLRVWTGVKGDCKIPEPTTYASQTVRLVTCISEKDSSASSKYYGMLYKAFGQAASIYHSGAGDSNSRRYGFALQLRKFALVCALEGNVLDAKGYYEQALRCSVIFEQASPPGGYTSSTLRDFHDELSKLQDYKRCNSEEAFPGMCNLLEQRIYVAKKTGDFDMARHVCYAYANSVETWRSKVNDSLSAFSISSSLHLLQTELEEWSSKMEDIDFDELKTRLNVAFKKLEDSKSVEPNLPVDLISRLTKLADSTRRTAKLIWRGIMMPKLTKTALDDSKSDFWSSTERREPTKCTTESVRTYLITSITYILFFLRRVFENEAENTDKDATSLQTQRSLIAVIVEVSTTVAVFMFNEEDLRTVSQALTPLEQATTTAKAHGYGDGLNRLSSVYFSIGGKLYQKGGFAEAITYLRRATELSRVPQNSSIPILGNDHEQLWEQFQRLEILSSCYHKINDRDGVLDTIKTALTQFPQLVKVISSAFDYSSAEAVSNTYPSFVGVIGRYLRSNIVDGDLDIFQWPHELYPQDGMDEIGKAAVIELELRILQMQAQSISLIQHQMVLVDSLLEIYEAKPYPLRRARALLEKVRLISTSHDSSRYHSFAINIAEKALELLKSTRLEKDTKLEIYREDCYALALSWISLMCQRSGKPFVKNIQTALAIWKTVLRRVPKYGYGGMFLFDTLMHTYSPVNRHKVPEQQVASNVRRRLGDVDRLHAHLRFLADMLAATGQLVLSIQANRMILKINNNIRQRSVTSVQDALRALTCIGELYLDLGYTGRSGTAFGQGNKLCSEVGRLEAAAFTLSYARYFCLMGLFDKCSQSIRTAEIIYQKHKDEYPSRRRRLDTGEALVVAQANLVVSLKNLYEGWLEKAILYATNAVRLLCKVTMSMLKKAQSENRIPDRELDNPFLEDRRKMNTPIEDGMTSFLEQSAQYPLAKMIMESYAHIGAVYLQRGSVKESQYFFKQGVDLAEKMSTSDYTRRFLLLLAELEYRCQNLGQSEDNIQRAFSYLGEFEQEGRKHIETCLRSGDLALRKGDYEGALREYTKAREILNTLNETSYIHNLECALPSQDLTPTTKGLIQEAGSPSTSGNMSMTTIDTNSRIMEQLLHELDWKLCLTHLQAKNVEEAKAILRRTVAPKSSDPTSQTYFGLIGRATAMELRSFLKKKRKTVVDMNDNTDLHSSQLLTLITELAGKHARHRKSSSPQTVFTMSMPLATVPVVLPGSKSVLGAQGDAYAAPFYLETMNGLVIGREMYTTLNQQLHPSYGQSITWPAESLSDEKTHQLNAPPWIIEHLMRLLELYKPDSAFDFAGFADQYINILPRHWSICCISVDVEHEELYISRLKAYKTPITCRLRLSRYDKTGACNRFVEVTEEFTSIISESSTTTQKQSYRMTDEEKTQWWTQRRALDRRLQDLVMDLERSWLGGYKGLLSAESPTDAAIAEFSATLCNKVPQLQHSSASTLAEIILLLGSQACIDDIRDIVRNAFAEEGFDDSSDAEIVEDMLKLQRQFHEQYDGKIPVQGPTPHTILILDKNVQVLPWESLPCIRKSPVSRMPSLSLLRDRILCLQALHRHGRIGTQNTDWHDLTVDASKAFYILNPSGDLHSTENEFAPFVKSFGDGWDGIIGRPPMELEFERALTRSNLLLYFGHSGGEQYIRGYQIRKLHQCAVSFLLGCSSGLLLPMGEFDPHGNVMNYMLAGCPSVVANLWDVTDRDIDRFSSALFKNWGLSSDVYTGDVDSPNCSLVEAVAGSRDDCHLKYLIGAAPVVYGIPCYITYS